MVPKLSEKEVEIFFTLFERVADARGWVELDRITLLQCVLTGWAQEAFSSLSKADSNNYAKVKAVVLKAYDSAPEAYSQRFRYWKKGDKSYLELVRDLVTHFSSWCAVTEVKYFDYLSNLIVLEQFKNSVPEPVAMYINEQGVKTTGEAAALASDCVLTHRSSCVEPRN